MVKISNYQGLPCNKAKQSDPFSVPPLAALQMVACLRRYVYLRFGMFDFFRRNKCELCGLFCRDKKVKNPSELSTLIRLIKEEVDKGHLVALPQMDKGWEGEFSSLTI